jgi:ribonuclease G
LPWFRRRKNESDAPAAEPAAPQALPEPVVSEPAASDAADSSDPTKPKRRRGSRGGRGRKKPVSEASAETKGRSTAPKPRGEKKPQAERKPAKQLSQRQERRRSEGGSRRRQPPRRAPLPAAKRELLVSVDVGEQRVAVLEDDRVAEVYLERPERRSIAGNIYLGTVDNVLPGMEAAFVEIGLEKNGFLYVDEIVGPELERGHGRRIQDLISRGQTILVQAVKDPMKTKGARLTTQISLPGRFVVFVPQGEGLGVSRRLDDDERTRLKEILRKLEVKEGGVIVRTAAEGASEDDIERDLVFLQRLWKSIQAKAKTASAPEIIYQEAELPLRVTRDLFTGDFERALVDNDQAYKRITGYLKKTSPHMVERVIRYKDKPPLMEAYGVDAEIKSTIGRRVDLPSGGYLIFDYAEAFTVIDVNTGRFVGSRGKSAGGRLEDTITKNNLEAVKEVVRQLRLRDIGGIIVIDFIDMANPKNRKTVEDALREELERDRTKTYVVEISPLGLVEMTRQNVTDGPREVMTRKCPTCGGDGIVYSEASAAIDVERRLRALVAGSRSQAYRVELAASIASALIGPGARRLVELEALTKRRFFLEGKPDTHLDHFVVLAEGKLVDLAPAAPVAEGAEVQIELVEVDRHDASAAVGKLDGIDICVGGAASLVGKRMKVHIERVLDGTAYATLLRRTKTVEPLTAEAEAEKPTRKPPVRKGADAAAPGTETETEAETETETDEFEDVEDTGELVEDVEEPEEPEAVETEGGEDAAAPATPKKKTRRGSRGGRGRKKPAGATDAAATTTIHLPPDDLGARKEKEEPVSPVPDTEPVADTEAEEPVAGEASENGAASATAKKKTRRGSRGGRRRKKPAAAASANGDEPTAETALAGPEPEIEPELDEDEPEAVAEPEEAPADELEVAPDEEWGYVPMSEWGDQFER